MRIVVFWRVFLLLIILSAKTSFAENNLQQNIIKNKSLSDIFHDLLKDGSAAPAMVVIPNGHFTMGDQQDIGQSYEAPSHQVNVKSAFAMSIYPITFNDYDKFSLVVGKPLVSSYKWGRENRPVINVNLDEARDYVAWLSQQTGQHYRLPSEAEWEYANRAGTITNYPWGNEIGKNRANCFGCGSRWDRKSTSPVGSFQANPWGLFDMQGNVWELTDDCWNFNYVGAPSDGSAWKSGDCSRVVLRGGSWGDVTKDIRASTRLRSYAGARTVNIGFRIVRNISKHLVSD